MGTTSGGHIHPTVGPTVAPKPTAPGAATGTTSEPAYKTSHAAMEPTTTTPLGPHPRPPTLPPYPGRTTHRMYSEGTTRHGYPQETSQGPPSMLEFMYILLTCMACLNHNLNFQKLRLHLMEIRSRQPTHQFTLNIQIQALQCSQAGRKQLRIVISQQNNLGQL